MSYSTKDLVYCPSVSEGAQYVLLVTSFVNNLLIS